MTSIACYDLWKQYRMRRSRNRLLRDAIQSIGRRALRAPVGADPGYFWALRDFSIEVRQGESLGIIGSNGSGKSTMLKLVAGVTRPTRGRVEVFGHVGALIDVGTGLHPELTGQENIFLYGTILGLSRQEIRRKFDDIVEFSELHEFLDMPLKRYSSGMRVRLGFAVAAHLDPQILLVDEVLAVGDVAFQRKCIRFIRALQDAGTTIIFISHELQTVERVCQRVVWLDGGQVREVGPSRDVVHHYLDEVEQTMIPEPGSILSAGGGLTIDGVSVCGADGAPRSAFGPAEPVTVRMHYRTHDGPVRALVTLKIIDGQWTMLLLTRLGEDSPLTLHGSSVLECTFPSLPLAPKSYQVWAQVMRLPDYQEEIPWQAVGWMSIEGPQHATSAPLDLHDWEAPMLQVPATWSVAGRDRAGVADA